VISGRTRLETVYSGYVPVSMGGLKGDEWWDRLGMIARGVGNQAAESSQHVFIASTK